MAARELWTGWETVYAVDIQPAELRAEWAAARERFASGGGWPLAVTGWGPTPVDDEIFSRFDYGGEKALPPAAIIERATSLTLDDALAPRLAKQRRWDAEDWDAIVARQLERTRRRIGTAPGDLATVHGDSTALERRLLEWEEARQPTTAPEDGRYLDWFDDVDNCSLLFLPVTHSEHAVAYVSFHGAEGEGRHELLIAILRSWRERFGAELVANWGTMLEFRVTRPPRTLEDAFALAVEQDLLAPMTLTGATVRDHARALLERPEWFLHDRP